MHQSRRDKPSNLHRLTAAVDLATYIDTSRMLRRLIGRFFSVKVPGTGGAVCLVLGLLFLLAQPVGADTLRLREEIEKILLEKGVPGASISLIYPGGMVKAFGVGVADLETGEEVDEDTRFRAGSITKSLTALLVLQLVEEGRLSLDDPICEIAPEIRFENPWKNSSPVLVRHLLEHTAGFDDMTLCESWSMDQTIVDLSLSEVLELRTKPLKSRYTPGTLTSYSNAGYTIVGYLVEKLTGESYENLAQKRIFEPLDMKNASLSFTGNEADVSHGYQVQEDFAFPAYQIYHRPAGSLVVSAKELANFVQMLCNRGGFGGRRLLEIGLLEEMEEPHASMAAQASFSGGYGAGIHADLRYPIVMHGHDGGMPGFIGTYAYHREEGFGLVVLLNAASSSALAQIRQTVFDEVAGLREPPVAGTITDEELEAWAGHFRLMTFRPELAAPIVRLFDRVNLRREGNRFFEEVPFGSSKEFVPTGDGSFRRSSEPVGSRRFFIDQQGRRWLLTPDDAYLEASPWLWRSELFVIMLAGGISVLPLLWIPLWAVGSLWRRSRGVQSLAIAVWPTLASASLVIALLAPSGLQWMEITTVNPRTLTLAIGSAAFGLFALLGMFRSLVVASSSPVRTWLVPQLLPAIAQLSLAIYLWYWGLLGLRLWTV